MLFRSGEEGGSGVACSKGTCALSKSSLTSDLRVSAELVQVPGWARLKQRFYSRVNSLHSPVASPALGSLVL